MPKFLDVTDTNAARRRISAVGYHLPSEVANAQEAGEPLLIPAGDYTTLDNPTDVMIIGSGVHNTVFTPGNGEDGVVVNAGSDIGSAQYISVRDFLVDYPRAQTRDDTESAGVVVNSVQFSDISNVLVRNGFHGFRSLRGTGHNQEFNNLWSTLRAYDCWKPFTFESQGSGSAHINLYASSPGRSSVLHMLRCIDFSGEFIRTNLEHSTVRDKAIDLQVGHNVSFRGLHMEGLSFPAAGYTPLDGNLASAIIRTTGQGIQTIDNWTIDTSHFGAMLIKPFGLTRTGSTARAELHLMGFQQKTEGGHGFEVGDSIFIEGADTGTSGAYNGAHIVTAVGSDWVEFSVTGTPATPADVATGCDCITASIGDSALYNISLVRGEGDAGQVRIGNLHLRDIRIIGATPSRRQNMLRIQNSAGAPSGNPLDVQIESISFSSQRTSHGYWREPAKIMGYSRTNDVATYVFNEPHNIRPTSVLHITGTSDASFSGVMTGGVTPISPFALQVSNAGSDVALTAANGSAILQSFAISNVSRDQNYATITTSTTHNLYGGETGVGLRVAISASDTAYNTTDAVIVDVPSATTFKIRNVGSNEAIKVATGSVMLIEGGISTGTLTAGTSPARPHIRGWDDFATVIQQPAIAAGATVTARRINNAAAQLGRDYVSIVNVTNPDNRLQYSGEVYSNGLVDIKVTNPTSDPVTPPRSVIRYKLVPNGSDGQTPQMATGVLTATAQVDSPANSVSTIPRDAVTGTPSLSTGLMRMISFVADKSFTASNFVTRTGTTAAAATPTLCRVGLYTVDASGNCTLVAATGNNYTMWAATNTTYTQSLGGLTYPIVAGTRYAVGFLIVTSATAPSLQGSFNFVADECYALPWRVGFISDLTDLPSTVSYASISPSTAGIYARLV